jgi:plasmid stabilization system protein ParE
VKALAAHPEIGRPMDEPSGEIREWFIRFGDSFYVTLYRYDGTMNGQETIAPPVNTTRIG